MYVFFFFKQKTAYEMRISDWSSDVRSSDLQAAPDRDQLAQQGEVVDLIRQFARGKQALPVGGEAGEVGHAAQRLQRLVGLEIGAQGDGRDHGLAVEQVEDSFVDRKSTRLNSSH